MELQSDPALSTSNLDDDDMAAIAAYTHDLGTDEKEGNFYFELNTAIRQRGMAARQSMMKTWGVCVRYLLRALRKLPAVEGIVWRGMGRRSAQVLEQYYKGRPIQWGAFSSTTTSFEAAATFTDQSDGVILKLDIHSGRVVKDFSFFPCED